MDSRYQLAVSAISGTGGWPLTVFLTPDGHPFYGGTYFPPDDRWGRPSFKKILLAIADAYRERRDEVLKSADETMNMLADCRGLMPDVRPSFRRESSASWCSRRCPSSTRRTAASAARRSFPIPLRSIC